MINGRPKATTNTNYPTTQQQKKKKIGLDTHARRNKDYIKIAANVICTSTKPKRKKNKKRFFWSKKKHLITRKTNISLKNEIINYFNECTC